MMSTSLGTCWGVERMISFGNRRALTLIFGACLAGAFPVRAFATCPGQCLGGTNHGARCFVPADCPGFGASCGILATCVRLEWRPAAQSAPTNGIFEVGLYAVNDSHPPAQVPSLINVQGIDLIMSWLPSRLQLLGTSDPCRMCLGGSNAFRHCTDNAQCPASTCGNPDSCGRGCVGGTNQGVFCDDNADCPGSTCGDFGSFCLLNTYHWFSSFFPQDCNLDGVNAPCPGGPGNDGDAFYQAISQILCNGEQAEPAMSTQAGLLVTNFRFRMLAAAGGALVHIVPASGQFTHTRVIGGDTPGQDVTGLFGADATITVGTACNPPTVTGLGDRYLGVTPAPGTGLVALKVRGNSGNVICVNKYVQANCQGGSSAGAICSTNTNCPGGVCTTSSSSTPGGTLGTTAVYRTPADWGTVAVRSELIGPLTAYDVRADCGTTPGVTLSNPVTGTTWRWGDTNGNAIVNFIDVTNIVAAFQSGFTPTRTLEMVDLNGAGCVPNRLVNFQDVSAAVGAFQSKPFTYCSVPCP